MTEDEVVAEFQRRRHQVNTRAWPACLIGVLLFYGGGKALNSPRLAVVGLIALFAGVLLLIAGIRAVYANIQCPACNKSLQTGDGVPLDPAECRHCGARLK